MIKNLIPYKLAGDLAGLEDKLAARGFEPCGPTQQTSAGWVPPRGVDHGALVEEVAGQKLLAMKLETKKVPAQTLKRRVEEMAAAIEEQTGRKPGNKVRKELKEQALHDLLPAAFATSTVYRVWISTELGMLFVDASSQSKADLVTIELARSAPDLTISMLQTKQTPAAGMAEWLLEGEALLGFTIDRELELKAEDETKASVKYARHSLDLDEIREHLTQGKVPKRLALTFRDRVSFTLTDDLRLTKIEILDVCFESGDKPAADDAFDADAAIATGELSLLIPAIIEALGGEHVFAAAQAAGGPAQFDGEADDLLDKAIEIVSEHKRASISLVQRHLQIGYNRAARLLEAMESRRIVSAMKSDGTRDILKGAA